MMTTAPTREKPSSWDREYENAHDNADDQASAQIKPAFRSQRPKCPDCGGVVLLADNAHFNPAGRIDHVWSCDDCANEFVTSISLVRPLAV